MLGAMATRFDSAQGEPNFSGDTAEEEPLRSYAPSDRNWQHPPKRSCARITCPSSTPCPISRRLSQAAPAPTAGRPTFALHTFAGYLQIRLMLSEIEHTFTLASRWVHVRRGEQLPNAVGLPLRRLVRPTCRSPVAYFRPGLQAPVCAGPAACARSSKMRCEQPD